MIKNFFLVAFRNLGRNKTFSILNIGGLSLGIAVCIITILFVINESNFDSFHTKADRIYRLNEVQRLKGMQEQTVSLSMFPMAPAFSSEYPIIEEAVRLFFRDDLTIRGGDQQFIVDNLAYADSNFLKVFDFELLEGSRQNALQNPKEIFLTSHLARKLFGTEKVTGQTIVINANGTHTEYAVAGILKDIPSQSHLQFEALLPFSALKREFWMETWDANWVNTYLLLKENADVSALKRMLPAYEKKYLKEQDEVYDLSLQPLRSVHLDSGHIAHDYSNNKKFSREYVNIFLWIAVFVLLIALLNFINLSTARAAKRAREVGVRKAIGARRWQLVKQFIGEALLFTEIAFLIGLLLATISLHSLNMLIERELSINDLLTPEHLSMFVGGSITVGLLAGIYPAIVLSGFKPVRVLKGLLQTPVKSGISFRNSLVIVQFSIAVILIVSALFINRQLNFIKNKDVGFDKEQVMLISMNKTANDKYNMLKNEFLKNAGVADITGFNWRLGNNIGAMGAKYISGNGGERKISVSHLVVDHNYLSFFNIPIVEGRNFSRDFPDDSGRAYIINQTLARDLETKTVVGTLYSGAWLKKMGKVIGVAKDFNFNSLHHKIAPLYLSIQGWDFREIAVKIKPGAVDQTVDFISKQWTKLVPDMPFTYTFLDEHMANLYKADRQVSKVVDMLTLLTIIIACLGLFGLALYNVELRTKEIGIRKVLGASTGRIVKLLSMEFLKPVGIALIIAFPIAWYGINLWLEDYSYRISVNPWVFAAAGVTALAIAIITVSFQSITAAIRNPVKSLRTE